MITVCAPDDPGVPVVVTPVVYSVPPAASAAVANLKGCPELELSD